MKNNTLESYKEAIREKYETEKMGEKSYFLLQPSRAKLRDLCFEIFKENSNATDANCFKAFLGFEFSSESINKLKILTDKFRPLETFLKGETDLTDLSSVDMTAILINFEPRPYLKFCKSGVLDSMEVEQVNHKLPSSESEYEVSYFQEKAENKKSFPRQAILVIAILLVTVMGLLGYQMWNKNECLLWNDNQYELVDCETEEAHFFQSVDKKPYSKSLLALRKIEVSDTTTFFRREKPQVWYCKSEKRIDYFNGPGFHPVNGKILKPITNYMVEKYVLKKE